MIGYELRMPRPRDLPRVLIAASAVVVAACVATLTVTIMTSGLPLVVRHETTYDSGHITERVTDILRDRGAIDDVDSVLCQSGMTVSTGPPSSAPSRATRLSGPCR